MPPRLSVDIVGTVESGGESFIVLAIAVKTVGIASLLLALAGCVSTAGRGPVSEAEQSESVAQLKACVERNRGKFDDGKSAPIDVAIKIVDGPCARENAALLEVQRRTTPPEKRGTYSGDAYPISYLIAQGTIIDGRAAR